MLSDEIKSLTKGGMLTEEEAKYVEEAGFNPMDIVNFKEFKKFYEISQKPILNEKKIRIATDGREVNLAWLPHIFKKKMEGLSKAEYAKFDALRMVYLRNMGEMNRARQFAIGANHKGMYGQARAFKILDEAGI